MAPLKPSVSLMALLKPAAREAMTAGKTRWLKEFDTPHGLCGQPTDHTAAPEPCLSAASVMPD